MDTNPLQQYRTSAFEQNLPFGVSVAKGWVNGVQAMYKFGRNPLCSSANEDIWDGGGLYTFLSNGQGVTIKSTDKSDGSTGTGAKTMQVYGLDSDGLEINEVVTLDGDTDVTLTNTYWRLNRMKVLTCGSTDTNLGTITATSTDSTVMASILPSMGQTLMAIYTVPANKTAILRHAGVSMGAASKTANARLYMRESTGAWQVKHTDEVVEGESDADFEYFPEIPGKTDIRWEINLQDGQTNEASADFMLYLFEADS